MRKLIICLVALLMIFPSFTSAATVQELQNQIASLLSQIQQLQTQLQQMQGNSGAWCHTFNTDLKIGDQGNEVSHLLTALTKEGLASDNLSTIYDEKIASYITAFQEKYVNEVLNPIALSHGTGYLGGRTRAKLNVLYGCGNTKPVTTPTSTACTTDVKLCSDGKTYVSRTGTNCEFAICPAVSTQTYTPTIDYYNPSLVIPGETMTLIGSNYDQSAYVVIDGVYPSITPSSITAGAGRHSLVFPVPSALSTGTHYVQVGVKASPLSNKISFVVQVPTTTETESSSMGTIIPSTTFAEFNVQRGSANPPYMAIHLTNSSSVPITFTQSVPNQPGWLNVSYNTEPMSLNAWGVIGTGVAVDATKVNGTGTYTTNLIISGNFTNSPITIPITLTVY